MPTRPREITENAPGRFPHPRTGLPHGKDLPLLVIPAQDLAEAGGRGRLEAGRAAIGPGLDAPLMLRGENGDAAAALRGVDALAAPEETEIFGAGHVVVPLGQRLADSRPQPQPGNF